MSFSKYIAEGLFRTCDVVQIGVLSKFSLKFEFGNSRFESITKHTYYLVIIKQRCVESGNWRLSFVSRVTT